MKVPRIIGFFFIALAAASFLVVQAQQSRDGQYKEGPPKDITITQLMNKYRKDAFSSNLDERRRAFEGFYLFSRNVNPTVTNLASGLLDPDAKIREYAVTALANIGPPAISAVPDLKRMLEKEKDAGLRAKAAAAIGAVFSGSHPEEFDNETILALASALREDPSALVRHQACIALGQAGCGAKGAMEYLIDAMLRKESDPKLCELARNAIFSMAGPGCADHAPRLLELYRKGEIDESTQFTVLCALGQIAAKEDEVVPLLVGVLKSNDQDKKRLREAAAFGLCAMRAKAKNAIPALVEAFEGSLKVTDGSSLNLRQNILDGLPKLGPDARNAIPSLTVALEGTLKGNDEHSSELRLTILNLLTKLGPVANGAIPTLRKIADDPSNSPEIRNRAAKTLKSIEKSKK